MNPASWLHGVYLFTAIVGIGVTAVDMLGLFGDVDGDSNGDTDTEMDGVAGEAGSLLSILRYLRTGVYFCVGFGPLGIVAEFLGTVKVPNVADVEQLEAAVRKDDRRAAATQLFDLTCQNLGIEEDLASTHRSLLCEPAPQPTPGQSFSLTPLGGSVNFPSKTKP